jgi:2-polyprenyl-3-methyl-5-hydroxy-6-metoxy-1,4-benzoquinol methylase
LPSDRPHPLDYSSDDYAYVERANPAVIALLRDARTSAASFHVLDVGCGAGAHARALGELDASVRTWGIEPNRGAASLAGAACSAVFAGSAEQWLSAQDKLAGWPEAFDAVLLSDVLEHQADPLGMLRSLTKSPRLERALYVVSVPNFAVWYNRARTLLGRFEYAESGLYDRTHLRFFTRASLARLLEYAGFRIERSLCTPSLVQAFAPILRMAFERDVQAGDHLSLFDSGLYRGYRRFVEPVETWACQRWPELLGFQLVVSARRDARGAP